jgi:hypothetical protein
MSLQALQQTASPVLTQPWSPLQARASVHFPRFLLPLHTWLRQSQRRLGPFRSGREAVSTPCPPFTLKRCHPLTPPLNAATHSNNLQLRHCSRQQRAPLGRETQAHPPLPRYFHFSLDTAPPPPSPPRACRLRMEGHTGKFSRALHRAAANLTPDLNLVPQTMCELLRTLAAACSAQATTRR